MLVGAGGRGHAERPARVTFILSRCVFISDYHVSVTRSHLELKTNPLPANAGQTLAVSVCVHTHIPVFLQAGCYLQRRATAGEPETPLTFRPPTLYLSRLGAGVKIFDLGGKTRL